jgi:hypothetical protein
MTEPGFAELFQAASAEVTGGRAYLPGELVDQWSGVVDLVLAGYDGSLDEYFSDLAVRRSVDAVLESDLLTGRPELNWIREQIAATDERLRALQQNEPLPRSDSWPWWRRFPPRYAGSELSADYLSTYGVRVTAQNI